ncbi:MAG: hypothetical protein AAGM36_11245 [Cyanobacteria bacterium J06597_1]
MYRSSIAPKLVLFIASNRRHSRGYALVVAIGTIVVLSTLLASYSVVTKFESLTASSSQDSSAGFYAAEAGLNLRAEEVRAIFDNFETPTGTPEVLAAGELPCRTGVGGTGDYTCTTYNFQDFSTQTGLTFVGTSNITIGAGEPFQFLSAQELRYLASAIAYENGDITRPQAILGMNFLNRRVPMFQFMAFYDKDLEITPGSSMTLNGPIHANANVFLNAQGDTLSITDRLTIGRYSDGTLGELYRRRKHNTNCTANSVNVNDSGGTPVGLNCSTAPIAVPAALNDRVELGFPRLDIPPAEDFAVGASNPYWSLADLRIALRINGASRTIEVRNPDESLNGTLTTILSGCSVTSNSNTFYNTREGQAIEMLDVQMQPLLDCIDANSGAFGFQLDDSTQDGLVFYFTVDGPLSDASAAIPVGTVTTNNYGVRLINGSTLQGTSALADTVQGLTVVTDQAVYIQGNYNNPAAASDWVPASVISDSMNILSNAWSDDMNDGDGHNDTSGLACTGSDNASCPWQERLATNTTINAAFLSGTSSTGGSEGGTGAAPYNGGMHNFPRLHEVWTGNTSFPLPPATPGPAGVNQTLSILGSFVSLQQPDHVDGAWLQGSSSDPMWYYQQPVRNWSFETRFRDPNTLPPMTPQFNFLRQELFVRDFTQ